MYRPLAIPGLVSGLAASVLPARRAARIAPPRLADD
jgi:hypothetical protein